VIVFMSSLFHMAGTTADSCAAEKATDYAADYTVDPSNTLASQKQSLGTDFGGSRKAKSIMQAKARV